MSDPQARGAKQALRFPVRHFHIARVYGPGMKASADEGHKYAFLDLSVSRIGLVCVHCWNLGEATGPYPISPDAHSPGETAHWVPSAHRIIAENIVPVLSAARTAGVAVFHLAHPVYARRYPQFRAIQDDPDLQEPADPADGCVRPWTFEQRCRKQYGEDYPGPVWETHADTFDIAEAVRPRPDESVVVNGWQINGLCRRKNIDTLFYVGFMADLCIVNIPGAMREMTNRFGYRCIVLRDCTTAYEFADTYRGRWMNLAAIRLIETDIGYSTLSGQFVSACATMQPLAVQESKVRRP